MTNLPRLLVVSCLLVGSASAEPQLEDSDDLRPPSSVIPSAARREQPHPLATTEEWGGGVRVTGLSGIGALPGVNYGAEVACQLRRGEYFAELGFGWWKPEKPHVVTEAQI